MSTANNTMTGFPLKYTYDGKPKKFLLDDSTYSKMKMSGMYAAAHAKKGQVLRMKPGHIRRDGRATSNNNPVVLAAD